MALNGIKGKGSKRPYKGSRKFSAGKGKNDKPVFDKKGTGKLSAEEPWLKSLIGILEKKLDNGELSKSLSSSILKDLKNIKSDIDKGGNPKDKDLLKTTGNILKSGKKSKSRKSIPSSPYGPITSVPRGKFSNTFFPGVPALKAATGEPTGVTDLSGMGAIKGVPLGELPQGLAPGVPKLE